MEHDGDSQSERCDIYPNLENSRISSQCYGDHKLLTEQPNVSIILKRCGIFDEDHVIDLKICERHLDRLGKFFKSRFISTKTCLWRDHPKPKSNVDEPASKRRKMSKGKNPLSSYRIINEKNSRLLLDHHNFLDLTIDGALGTAAMSVH